MRFRGLWFACVAVCIASTLIGCAKKATPTSALGFAPPPVNITESNQTTLLPLADGNTWVYDAVTQETGGDKPTMSGTGEVVFKVSNVKKVGDSTQGLLSVTVNDQNSGAGVWRVGPDGIVQLSGGKHNEPYSKPEPVVSFPLATHPTIKWTTTGPMPDDKHGSASGVTTVTLAPQIDTAVSTVSGIESTTELTYSAGDETGTETSSTFLQPGVGIVRLVQSTKKGDRVTTVTIRLKSWTVQRS